MTTPRYFAQPVLDDEGSESAHVVVNTATGEQLAFFHHANDAYWFAVLLDVLASGAWPEDVLLGIGEHRRFLRRLKLKHPGVCFRCGKPMEPGEGAFWHPVSRVIRHVGSCRKAQLSPKRALKRRRRRA